MEILTLTNFAGLNTKSPEMELPTNPIESPNIINAVMEEGTIYCRAPQNIHYPSSQLGTGNINTFFVGELGNQLISIAQINNTIKKRCGAIKDWWDNNWGRCRKRTIKNLTIESYINLILDWRLPIGFNYSNIKTNGEDLRFIVYENNIPKELPYWIKEWSKVNAVLLPTTGILTTMSLTTQPTLPSILKVTITNATTLGNIVIKGKDVNNNAIEETLAFTANGIKETLKQFINVNAISTSSFTGGTIGIEGLKESIIYIKLSIEASTSIIVSMYYDNPNAESKSNEKSVATIYNTFDTIDEKDDFIYEPTSSPPITASMTISNGIAKISKTGNGHLGFYYYNKKLDTDFILEVDLKTFKIEIGSEKELLLINKPYVLFTGLTIGHIYRHLEWGSELYFGEDFGFDIIPFENVVNQWYKFRLIANPFTKKITGEIVKDNVIIYSKTFNYSGRKDFFPGFGCKYGQYLNTGEVLHADNFKVFQFLPTDISKIEILNMSTEIPKPSESNWVILYDAVNPPIPSTLPYQILVFLNKFIFITEDKDIQTWNGTITTALPGPKKAKFGLIHKHRLWLFNFPLLSTSMFWYSNINKIMAPVDWQTTGTDNIEYIKKDDGFDITGVGIMSDQIVVFKENTAYLIYGDIPNITIKRLNIDVGCLASRSIVDWKNGLFFLSKQGIHFIRGTMAETPIIFTVDNIQTDNLATKIMPTFNNLNKDYLKYAIGVIWNDRYFCAVPTYNSIVNNILLVLDYNAGWWSYWVPPEPITSMFVDPIENVFYLGTTNGNIRIQNIRNFKINENMLEDDKSIPSKYETGYMDLGIPNVRKRLRFINITFSGSVQIDLNIDKRTIPFPTLSTDDKNILINRRIPLLERGKFFKLQIKDFTKQIHSINLIYDYMRV